MKLEPLDGRVIVRMLEPDKIAGGLSLINTESNPVRGEVLAVAEGEERYLKISVGDTVLFSKFPLHGYGGGPIKISPDTYILSAYDLLAVERE